MGASEVVESLAEALGGAAISRIGRIALASDDAVIPMLHTVVLMTGAGHVVLRYDQSGLSCTAAPALRDTWPPDDLDDDERVEITDLPGVPATLPTTVVRVTAHVGTGPYDDVLGFSLHTSGGAEIPFTTVRESIDLTTPEAQLQEAERAATAQRMDLHRISIPT